MGALDLPRPFLKWAGGKSRLAATIAASRPRYYGTYHEPFVGSGALFFYLYRHGLVRRAILSDINAELISTYRAIRDHVEQVIKILSTFPYDEKFYYELRQVNPFTLDLPHLAARMIYLNKTGYNGLYRVNSKGEFNVPFGRYKRPRYLDPDNLRAVSKALQRVDLRCVSFEAILSWVEPGDWVYCDPPYVPISATSNFTEYQPNGFGLEEHYRLRDVALQLFHKGAFVTLSNSDTEMTRELYGDWPFELQEVLAPRFISSKASSRGKVGELLIHAFPQNERSVLFERQTRYQIR